MVNINNKVKQAFWQNWGKPNSTEKKISETNLRNSEEYFWCNDKVKTWHFSKKKKELNVWDIILVDSYSVNNFEDPKKSLSSVNLYFDETWNIIKYDFENWYKFLSNRDDNHKHYFFSGQFEVEIIGKEKNKRDKKYRYTCILKSYTSKYSFDNKIEYKEMFDKYLKGKKGIFKL